jgi:hypothetical protein
VNAVTKLKVASALMGVGVVPMMLWFAMLANAVRELRLGEFDLSDVMFTGVAGMLAYLSTLVIAGAGALWAIGLRRAAPERPRRVARNLMWLTAGVLLVPWLAVLGLLGARMLG